MAAAPHKLLSCREAERNTAHLKTCHQTAALVFYFKRANKTDGALLQGEKIKLILGRPIFGSDRQCGDDGRFPWTAFVRNTGQLQTSGMTPGRTTTSSSSLSKMLIGRTGRCLSVWPGRSSLSCQLPDRLGCNPCERLLSTAAMRWTLPVRPTSLRRNYAVVSATSTIVDS